MVDKKIIEKYIPHFNLLSITEQNVLINDSKLVKYKKGDFVHNGEYACLGGVIVLKGLLRVYMISEEGKEITLYRLYPQDMCMLTASCVLKAVTFDVSVSAIEDSEIVIVNPQIIENLCDHHLEIKNYFYEIALERFSDIMSAMQEILFKSFDKRLAGFLFEEMDEENSINMTHEDIAKYLGSAREVVSRMLKYFTDEGIVKISRGKITVINKDKLKILAY